MLKKLTPRSCFDVRLDDSLEFRLFLLWTLLPHFSSQVGFLEREIKRIHELFGFSILEIFVNISRELSKYFSRYFTGNIVETWVLVKLDKFPLFYLMELLITVGQTVQCNLEKGYIVSSKFQ